MGSIAAIVWGSLAAVLLLGAGLLVLKNVQFGTMFGIGLSDAMAHDKAIGLKSTVQDTRWRLGQIVSLLGGKVAS